MKKIIFAIGIIALISCRQNNSDKSNTSNLPTEIGIETEKLDKEAEKSKDLVKTLNQDSLAVLWESNLKNIALTDKRFDLKKEPYTNHHDELIIDTIKTLTYEKSQINIYKAQNFEAIMNAKIRHSDIEIMEYLRIGTKKYHVEKTLGTEISNDEFKVGNLEQTVVFTLKFESGELKIVEFDGYVD